MLISYYELLVACDHRVHWVLPSERVNEDSGGKENTPILLLRIHLLGSVTLMKAHYPLPMESTSEQAWFSGLEAVPAHNLLSVCVAQAPLAFGHNRLHS